MFCALDLLLLTTYSVQRNLFFQHAVVDQFRSQQNIHDQSNNYRFELFPEFVSLQRKNNIISFSVDNYAIKINGMVQMHRNSKKQKQLQSISKITKCFHFYSLNSQNHKEKRRKKQKKVENNNSTKVQLRIHSLQFAVQIFQTICFSYISCLQFV